jgi:hypothetical protein
MITREFGSMSEALFEAGLATTRRRVKTGGNLTGPSVILEAIGAWVRLYGSVPTLADWDPARARRLGQDWRIARYYGGDWPSTRSVTNHFGSMSSAVSAAGFEPRPQGSHGANQMLENRSARRRLAHRGAPTNGGAGANGLAHALRTLAAARRAENPVSMHEALMGIAEAALAWADVVVPE